MLGWRTMIQLFARRAAENNAFSVPDHNALWSRAEDDLLVQAVAKQRLHGSCPGALRSHAKSVTGLLIPWWK